ncbi:oligosaccharide flippase family protein [Anaerocolumna sedimenticola]|uniref:Oligosaccharide flippase family protein n=1 Tax=Anaerocolumna sedimenticola TaxID=2696063 RepID=A0A6P1TRX2_9FIRM|nr:polysaccharide biosynthesis protein [Anaerocolumna sedimenticola]QHQ62989.1 oligosaccharide flippase family protein [Anaerocolumna sedimenticola]
MSKQSRKNNFIKQAGILALAGIICRIIGILYRRPLTELLGTEGLGYYSISYNIYAIILLISSYSIPSALSKEMAKKLILKEYKNAQKLFHCAIVYVFIVGGLASFFTYFCASFLVENNSVIVLQVFAPTIFLSGLLGVFRGYFQAHRTMHQTSLSQILEQIFNAVVSILAAYFFIEAVKQSTPTTQAIYGAIGSAIGTGAGVLIALLFMLIIYLLNKGFIQKRIQRDIDNQTEPYVVVLRRIFFTITPIILSTFIYNLSTTLNQTIYTKLLIYLKGFEEKIVASQYGIFSGEAVVITNIPIALASAIAASILPSISGTYSLSNIKDTNRKIDMAIRTTMLISIPSAVGLAVLSRPIVQILFPQKDTLMQASEILRFLSITVIFYSLSTVTNAVLQGINKVNLPVINALISLVIQTTVLVVILLFTDWNIYALTIAAIVYSFLMCVLNGFFIRKKLGYRLNIRNNILIPFAASAIMGMIARLSYILFYVLCKSNTISIFLAIIIAIPLYGIIVIKFGGINESELIILPNGKMIVGFAKKLKLL